MPPGMPTISREGAYLATLFATASTPDSSPACANFDSWRSYEGAVFAILFVR